VLVPVPLQRTVCISQCDPERFSSSSRAHCPRVYRARRRVVDPVRHLAPGPVPAQRRPECISQCCTQVSPSEGPSGSPSLVPSASPSDGPALLPVLAPSAFSQCWLARFAPSAWPQCSAPVRCCPSAAAPSSGPSSRPAWPELDPRAGPSDAPSASPSLEQLLSQSSPSTAPSVSPSSGPGSSPSAPACPDYSAVLLPALLPVLLPAFSSAGPARHRAARQCCSVNGAQRLAKLLPGLSPTVEGEDAPSEGSPRPAQRCRPSAGPGALQRTAECISQCDAERFRAAVRAHCPRVYRARRRVVDPVRPQRRASASPAAASVSQCCT
jgi:hypothetical protein